MNRSPLRLLVIVTAVITAAIHLALGVGGVMRGDMMQGPLFVANAVGYAGLLAAVLGRIPFLPAKTAHALLIVYAAVTIAAYFLMSGGQMSPLGIFTKIDEAALIIFTFLHRRASY